MNFKNSIEYNDNMPACVAIVGYLISEDNKPTKVEEIIDSYDRGYDIIYEGYSPYFDSSWGNWLPGDDGEPGFITEDDWKDWKKYVPEVVKGLIDEKVLVEINGKIQLESMEGVPTADELMDECAEYYADMDWDYDPY